MSGPRQRVALYTMGCKTNQYDSGRLAEEFAASGFDVVPFTEVADVYVVNSCTVTGEAEREAIRAVRRALARNPGALLVATGCCPQVNPRPFEALAGVRLVGGNDLKRDLVGRVRQLLNPTGYTDASAGSSAAVAGGGARFGARTRRVVKIQEGCNYRCAYCVVPHARGGARSRPLAEVLEEVRVWAEAGHREVVLTGTCLGSYGTDLSPRVTLAECAAAVAAVPGVARVRLSSIEPWEVKPDLVELAARNPAVCPHFHLPLQSGDDDVRRRMCRPGSSARFLELVALLRERVPDVGITTDVMVGFPGESDAQFAATYEFCRRVRFS
ncbi:MAG: MiaB/RimO family radical SAM methylthiotransferase, partial [Armatimonadota bacterium]|nr:MiaB/RimO family radical SAM methylthiotransferase [Armatimonadota bacterium]